ncbi:ATP-binding protein [Fusobacterium ulcerans]|uniref:ATP-binding protein n=1 Tax=Fusobacterium ulcerans TaxID=861 RepID=UPI001D0B714B|nr:ATP-binding protein [Fusobacterium ulcerans]MCB8564735.1 ATP-binding protein [Fusobacterium ulcerans]MCB8648883.1 ATP-binding protein [Fusobacterium ulcerans]
MKNIIRMSIPSSLENLSLIRALVKTYLEVQHINEKDIFQLLSVVDELSTNVVEHGYKYKPGDIILEIQKSNDIIQLIVEDNGIGFDEEKLSKEEGEMGLYIARAIADNFKIEKKLNGTLFKIEKRIKEAV